MRVRVNADGQLVSPGLNAGPDFGEITVADATGITLTTPTTAADIKHATLTVVGNSSGVTLSATAASITIRRPGLYLVAFNLGEMTAVNSQVVTIDIYKNAAVASPTIRASLTQLATAAVLNYSLAASGVMSLTKGDVLTVRGTADTGNLVVKRMHFYAVQLADLPAVTVTGE
jgi:hypothetical protein